MEPDTIQEIVGRQRDFFRSGKTKDPAYRKQQLKALLGLIRKNEDRILEALRKDMCKPALEAYASEIAITLNEIRHAVRKLDAWTKSTRVRTTVPLIPSLCYTVPEPLGVVLIIAPWNYPLQLSLVPLISAIAAGNCAVVKPSEIAPHTGRAMEELISGHFDPGLVSVVSGGADVAGALLRTKFDHIFYTGGARVARIVMEEASKTLTPVTLELGGKCPCIVDKDVNIGYAAKRIAWAKYFNAGQTCVAPDYVLVDGEIRDEFMSALTSTITRFYGENPRESPYYARIVNRAHFDRLCSYLDHGNIVTGGQSLAQELYLAPTVMDGVPLDSPLMQDEIFGPILPVVSYGGLDSALGFVSSRPKPLALYLFTRNNEMQDRVRRETCSGGYCINDAMVHLASPFLPFGGVGGSGMGAYHGKAGFDTFSHTKSIVKNTMQYDIPLRYVPYRFKLLLVKWFF